MSNNLAPNGGHASGAMPRFSFRLLAAVALLATCGATSPAPAPPSIVFGPLFERVQSRRLFEDSKTFADAVPKRDPAQIVADWRKVQASDDASLRAFVEDNFELPAQSPAPPVAGSGRAPILDHIRLLWNGLTRKPDTAAGGGSLLSLPKSYVVPGGRFRELYYWDSYFTMLGLKQGGRQDLVEAMIEDFGSLIDRFGHVPNGTRTYYLSRSQPPFFYLMTELSDDKSSQGLRRRNGWLRKEHAFWMSGASALRPGQESRHVVRLRDGSLLNRYWDERATPRDESWSEDTSLAIAASPRPPEQVYRDVRAAAESGWDFSSRWLGDRQKLTTIRTTRIVPIDLNSLLYGMERTIAGNCRILGDRACTATFDRQADARRRAVERHLWNPLGYYADYDLDSRAPSNQRTAAMVFPLFAGLATPDRARRTVAALDPLIGEGGLVTTLARTGQQWDAPNGWAPLQWIAVTGLERYGAHAPATRIATRWLATVEREYQAEGRLLEKYDVIERRPGGGGEYPLQDGFGWTNGVFAALICSGAAAEHARIGC
jgi:alpha,alpha-trehalase